MTPPTTTHPETPEPQSTAPSRSVGAEEGLREAPSEPTAEEEAAIMAEANAHREPPAPIPVRGRYYPVECEDCGWVGSSEQLGVHEDEIFCPVCLSSIRGDAPGEAEAAEYGEAVYQRIATLTADRDRLVRKLAARDARIAELEAIVGPVANGYQPHKRCLEWTTIQIRGAVLAEAHRLSADMIAREARASLTHGGEHGEP